MKFISLLFFLIILLFVGCSESVNPPNIKAISFPEFFIEKGSDSDTTYISLKGFRNNNRFEVQATGWGIWEYGLFLERTNSDSTINYKLMGQCGTVFSRTWTKVTLIDLLTPEETDSLWVISFTDFRDTITVIKTTTH
jgi:hypothetical protein